MPEYQKKGELGQETPENGDGAVALYKAPNMMAGAVTNNTSKFIHYKSFFKKADKKKMKNREYRYF